MKKIKILIPIYNDWKSVFKLLEHINLQTVHLNAEVSILIVNDGSTISRPEINLNLSNLKSVQIINMKENKGHARCNAAGLKYINDKANFDYVIPMDGDGEDRPEELKLLIDKADECPGKVITANRIKRSEGFFLKFCYFVHKFLTYIFTGKSIKFGNYTCLPRSAVSQMIQESATWSSFSGSLSKVSKEQKFISSIRGSRYFGPSKMSFFNLLTHSLSIIAVFKITVLVRSIIFLIVYIFLILKDISLVTLIPVALVIIMIFWIFSLSRRENIAELNNSLKNINDIENLK